MLKNKIFKYFSLEYLKIFLIVSISLSILTWMTQAARLLEIVTEYGNPISVYIKYIILMYPKILDKIFLPCFIITMFFLFNKLESSNELIIYSLSGISKERIINLVIIISLITILINIILSAFIAPWSSHLGRKVLGSSKFSLINSLVKENNFNSPLKGLTIYVGKNDKLGNLKGVFVYEKERTIIASTGEVLLNNNNYYLKLYDGTTYEKINNKTNIIKFESTIFDFSKYQLRNTTTPKYNERSNFWLIKRLKINDYKVNEIREELNKRLIKPFFILVLSILSCFLLINKTEKIKFQKYKPIIYFSSILLLVLNQMVLGLSGEKIIYSYVYFFFIIFIFLILLMFLKQKLKFKYK